MAMALMIQELNATNFGSGNAADGEVLTADGAGGAGWQQAGGGAAFDGAVFTPEPYDANSSLRRVQVELTRGGEAIASGTIWAMMSVSRTGTFTEDDGFMPYQIRLLMALDSASDDAMITTDKQGTMLIVITPTDGHAIATIILNNVQHFSDQVGYITVFLPNGGVVVSDMIEIGQLVMP